MKSRNNNRHFFKFAFSSFSLSLFSVSIRLQCGTVASRYKTKAFYYRERGTLEHLVTIENERVEKKKHKHTHTHKCAMHFAKLFVVYPSAFIECGLLLSLLWYFFMKDSLSPSRSI